MVLYVFRAQMYVYEITLKSARMVTINTILCFLNISLYYVLNSENETSNFNLFKNYFGYLFEFP